MYIDPTLYMEAPADSAGREEKELACYALLDRLGIPFARADHDSADTIELCHEIESLLGASICKNLFLCNAQKTAFYLLMMPGDKPFRTKDLSKQIGSARLSFAPPEHMLRCLNITPGSVSVLGLMNDREREVRLLIDRDLTLQEFVGCHPCVNTATLRLRTADVLEKLLPALGYVATFVEL
ncbi:MAG: prolyl-tRNA synthetase associated domain-containing protein [Ruminococcaceae bacterium]|nr:prolyl-tRNA synthetase associated domain-containing protein [Oscillospiraceae bacterium]